MKGEYDCVMICGGCQHHCCVNGESGVSVMYDCVRCGEVVLLCSNDMSDEELRERCNGDACGCGDDVDEENVICELCKDDKVMMEESTGFPIEREENGMYEWGFDLTDFRDKDDEDSVKGECRFKELLSEYGMELVSKSDKGYVWKNKKYEWFGSIVMVTGNNPITGEYCRVMERGNEKGYLGYVGVSSDSGVFLQEFINEFRKKACYIKGESNGREYI